MASTAETLRRLTIGDQQLIGAMADPKLDSEGMHRLDDRTESLVRLGVLIAIDAPQSSYQAAVDAAHRAGALDDDYVAVLGAIAGMVGSARVIAAAPRIALAAGYDMDAALERIDPRDHGEPPRMPAS